MAILQVLSDDRSEEGAYSLRLHGESCTPCHLSLEKEHMTGMFVPYLLDSQSLWITRQRKTSSLDSETYHDSRQQRPVSLSVFNAPTATYAWERYEPESQIPYPRPLYVDYTGRSSTRSASSSSISSLLDSPGMPSPALSDRSISTPTLLPQKRRSSSPAGHYHVSSVTKIMEPLRYFI
ncbi:hypothetical protein CY34DRAFT_517869 [Suillus luteus UH-Slu-Lm8-n1]|uniref:Unplaced genomic scaffold CY34scaffold_4, whole genome shotgun sequence n=1 Tax=Suillus luteus UH-Slu-Lm8-n1 TaxID=930992 RepID=A0A0D0BH10_9AGAM|nr:hypothetical protein CY34DRAFT_517869 [Suillus luteus UH-Slu-Lm8-n1]